MEDNLICFLQMEDNLNSLLVPFLLHVSVLPAVLLLVVHGVLDLSSHLADGAVGCQSRLFHVFTAKTDNIAYWDF